MACDKLKLNPPGGGTRLLLHTCCAPCSSAIIEALVANGITPVIYYYNPNIYPEEEYLKRKEEITSYAGRLGLHVVDGDYDYDAWRSEMSGLECEPERGARCTKCFRVRLLQSARYAKENGFSMFATTLVSSRWKDIDQIFSAGRYAADTVSGVVFWDQNWRKGGLYERRNELLKQEGFYNQTYCGCEFSMRINKEET